LKKMCYIHLLVKYLITIASLTINDIIGSAVIIPLHVPMFYNEGKWPLGLAVCKVAKVFSFGCFTTSGITIALIALNRFAPVQLLFNFVFE
jgi:7 transmembrane receptor (rhodopsin family)